MWRNCYTFPRRGEENGGQAQSTHIGVTHPRTHNDENVQFRQLSICTSCLKIRDLTWIAGGQNFHVQYACEGPFGVGKMTRFRTKWQPSSCLFETFFFVGVLMLNMPTQCHVKLKVAAEGRIFTQLIRTTPNNGENEPNQNGRLSVSFQEWLLEAFFFCGSTHDRAEFSKRTYETCVFHHILNVLFSPPQKVTLWKPR